ncbi:prepilin-type N-terminal cleavage/methylation domain-containing protein [Patescibacteria group bacterium]|nr:prepilin-type N-terminal cleavage/methylation domain-containing protein [Patescibacteria group bacterium]
MNWKIFRNLNSQVFKRPSDQRGSFTLVEMVVVLGITAFLAALLIANMRSGGEDMDLTAEAQKLAGIVRQAQMMSLTGQQVNDSRSAYGYGVYVDDTSYSIFSNDYDGSAYAYDAGGDTVIRSFNFLENIEMTNPGSPFYIIFTPPLGEIYASDPLPLNVALTYTSVNLNRYLRISSYGEVDIYR